MYTIIFYYFHHNLSRFLSRTLLISILYLETMHWEHSRNDVIKTYITPKSKVYSLSFFVSLPRYYNGKEKLWEVITVIRIARRRKERKRERNVRCGKIVKRYDGRQGSGNFFAKSRLQHESR